MRTYLKNEYFPRETFVRHSPPPFVGSMVDSDATIFRKASCACGGSCPACQTKSSNVRISQHSDPEEIEADQVADKVMRMPAGETSSVTLSKPHFQRKHDPAATRNSSFVVDQTRMGGRPLDDSVRQFFEPRLGMDLSDVRVHIGQEAAASARSIGAHAYTYGRDIVFSQDKYDPSTESGKRLLAHELVHVGQQTGHINKQDAGTDSESDPDSRPDNADGTVNEPEAEEMKAEKKKAEADPCTYKGKANKSREIHLNLALKAIRVYTKSGKSYTYKQFNDLITGPSTVKLAEQNGWCHMYPILGHQPLTGKKKLINYMNYCGEYGFHSNFWKKTGAIERIPGAQSHGCARLNDADKDSTDSGDSKALFDLVSDGDCVRIYSRDFWRPPTFKPCAEGADCSL